MKVKFTGASDSQATFGNCDDPRGLLVVGRTYILQRKEVHSWHTKYYLKEFPNKQFNSVCFEEVRK